MRTKKEVVPLRDLMSPTICTRDIVQFLFRNLDKKPCNEIELDFDGIEFISRSASHELLCLKERAEHGIFGLFFKKSIHLVNVNSNVAQLLNVVAANRVIPKVTKETSQIQHVDVDDLYAHSK
jgi:hypothetical protein